MARARNIKPAFFENDILADCQPLSRLLFIGLWTIADKAGRLEKRVKKIKAQLLPYDNCDCKKLLNELEKSGFIVSYKVKESVYIQILNFDKHQNPHIKETASTIPAPCKNSISMEEESLIPDSLLLIPDTGYPMSTIDDAVLGWNSLGLTQVQKLSPSREVLLRARLKDVDGLDGWNVALDKIEASDFLSGKKTDWKANFDFVIKDSNFTKIMEGNYDNGTHTTNTKNKGLTPDEELQQYLDRPRQQ